MALAGASRLALPAELLPAPDSTGYRIVAWQGTTPERWSDDMAVLNTRMSTDAPSAGLDTTAEVWDAERVRTRDELRHRGSRLLLLAAAEHVEDTLVLSDDRGHRLGMLVKHANLAAGNRHMLSVNEALGFVASGYEGNWQKRL